VDGSRNGKIVLVQLRNLRDPATGEAHTVKRYHSEKVEGDGDTWRHHRITLSPVNREYPAIVLEADDEESQVRTIAEFVEVVGNG
jgi:SOS-response transcriptional repressor LexA